MPVESEKSRANHVRPYGMPFPGQQKGMPSRYQSPSKMFHVKQSLLGNTAQSLCVRCEAGFFGRLHRNSAGILPYVKGFLCSMTKNQQADCVQSR